MVLLTAMATITIAAPGVDDVGAERGGGRAAGCASTQRPAQALAARVVRCRDRAASSSRSVTWTV